MKYVSPNFFREDAEILTKLQFYQLSVVSSHLCQSHYVQKINTLLGSYTCKVALMKMWKRNFTVKINTVELIISRTAHRAICFHCFQISTTLSRPRQQTMFGLHGPVSLALTDLHQLSWGGQGLRDGVSAPQMPNTLFCEVRTGGCCICLPVLVWDLQRDHTIATKAQWERDFWSVMKEQLNPVHTSSKWHRDLCGFGRCSTPTSLCLCTSLSQERHS